MRTNIRYCPHSEIINLGTLNATFTALSHTQLNLYSTSENTGFWKTGRFTAAVWPTSLRQKKSQLERSFGAPFIPSINLGDP